MMPGQRVDAVFAEIDLVSDRGATVKTHKRTFRTLFNLPNFGHSSRHLRKRKAVLLRAPQLPRRHQRPVHNPHQHIRLPRLQISTLSTLSSS